MLLYIPDLRFSAQSKKFEKKAESHPESPVSVETMSNSKVCESEHSKQIED